MALHFPITADNRQLIKSLEDSQNAVKSAMKNIEDSGIGVENMFHRIERAAALSVAGFSLKGVIDQAIETRSYFQDIESSMRVFLGSQEKAVEFTKKLQDAAYYNMFEFSDLADASKQLIAYRNDVEDVIPIINKLSEVATATKTPLAEMVSLYNRAKSTGTVDSNAIQSWATKGVVLKDIMKDLGVVTAGTAISFDQLNMALDHITDEGGMFHGIMDAQMENLSANIGQLEDNLSLMFNDIGSHLEGVANTGIKAAGELVDHWQEALAVIATIAASYGVNKAVEVGGIAINKASTSYGYEVELEQLRALLPAKEEEEQSTLKQAVASGRLSEAKALEIEETRKQVDALLEEATAREALALEEKEQADKEIESLTGNIRGLDEKIGKTKEYIESLSVGTESLEDLAGIEEYEAALDELSTLEREKNSAANELNSATERQNAAARNLTTASTERETLSTQINTAQTSGNAAAKDALSIASARLRVAMDRLNKVIDANKFAILTAALLALGAAIYKVCTYESDFTKMMKSAEEASKSETTALHSEISTLDKLKSQLESAKKGSAEWKSAKESIISQFGKYHSGLDEEIEKTGKLAKSYDNLTKSIRLSAAARAMEKFRSENDNTEEIDEFLEGIRRDLSGKNFKIGADGEIDRTKGLQFVKVGGKLRDSIMQKVYEWMEDGDLSRFTPQELGYLNQTGAFSYHAGGAGAKRIRENAALLKKGENLIAERYGTTVDEIDGRKPLVEDSETTLKEAYEEAKKKYEAQKALVDKMEKDRSSYSAKEYENAISALKGLKNEYEKYGGQTKENKSGPSASQLAAKEENAAGKLADVIRRQAQERLRLEQDYEYERWQTRINLMEEGEAKVLAQQELDFSKERTALERRKEQEVEAELHRQMALFDAQENVKAAGNKNYVKKVFRDSDIIQKEFDEIDERYKSLFTDLESQQKKAEQNRLDAAKESMNAYLKEFGSYQEKRLAIQEEYEKKISEAQNEGERMALMAQRNKTLSDLDYAEWVDTGAIALAFGDISKLSDKTITQLISDMEKYREKVIATFDPEKIEKYEEALTSLRISQNDESFGIISSYIPDYFKQRKATSDQMSSSAANVIALQNQRNALLMKKAGLEGSKSLGSNVGKDIEDVNAELGANEKAIIKAKNAFKILQEQWDQLETPQAKFGALCETIISTTDLIGGLASQGSEMAEALGAEGLSTALDTLGGAMNSLGNVASGFANGGIIGGIAAAAGEIMGWVGKIFSAGDNRKQKNIERLQEQVETLNKSYENLGKAIDEAFSTDASNLIDQQNTLLKQQQALIRQQMAEEEAKKKTDSDKIKQYQEQLEEINETIADNKQKAKEAIIGEDLKSAINEFATLYAEAWDDGTDAAQKSMAAVKNIISSALSELLKKRIQPAATAFYDALAKAMEDGVLTDAELDNLDALKKQIDDLAASSEEQYKMIQERYRDLDEIKEDLTDISFDSVRDNFKSKLADMSSSAKDFADDWSDMLRNAIINSLMDSKYDNMLKEWYDEFAEAMNDRTLTDSERDALRQQYDAIVQEGLADRDFINSIVGGGAYSQEATKGWSTTLTQDQGDELNGRFTAMTELEAINNSLVSEGNVIAMQILDTLRSLSSLSMVTDEDNFTLREIRDMMFLSTGHLEDIAKYSKYLTAIHEGIDKLNDLINQRL